MKTTPLDAWISEKIGDAGGRLDRRNLERRQLLKLRETIALAKSESPFYRKSLARLTENDLSNLRDLEKFPFTTVEDIQRSPLKFLCVSQSEIDRVVTLRTSGTTAEPKRVFFTAEDQELTVDFFHRGMAALAGPGDRVLVFLPWELPGSVGDLLLTGLFRLGALGIGFGPVRDVASALAAMVREKPDVLVGIPTQVLSLARCGGEIAAPRSVLLSTDHVPDSIVGELERTWGCEVFNHYGMTEMGFGGGLECEAHFGCHMREADLLFEIVDPLTGERVDGGGTGEVVFTTLTRRGMPLIRYRTGDISRFLPEPCPCGTSLKTMARVKGRVRERFQLPGGAVLTVADLDEALFGVRDLLDFKATLTRKEEVDCLNVEAIVIERSSERIVSDMRAVLSAVPAVELAASTGRFSVVVSIIEGAGARRPGPAKRTIDDRRDQEEK